MVGLPRRIAERTARPAGDDQGKSKGRLNNAREVCRIAYQPTACTKGQNRK
jgi:hypothetical protein